MTKFLITGGTSGIGREVARKLAARGATLLLSGRSAERLATVAEECRALGGIVAIHAGDITAPGAAEAILQAAQTACGGLEAVVHCAGVGLIKPSLDTTDAEFTRVMNINARGTFLIARESARVFAAQKRGLFITIPGILGRAPMKNAAAYAASKYAVTGMVKCMAQEQQRSGVRFCLLHYGGVDTPFWDGIGMAVQRDKMISPANAAEFVLAAIDLPAGLVLSEVVMQPESHQLV